MLRKTFPVVILAGGLGTRISEETADKPKPMVEVNGFPILKHLIDIFSLQGFTEIYIATGYMSHVIENWVDRIESNRESSFFLSKNFVPKIECIFTGTDTQTGGRIARALEKIDSEFVVATYGDGLANINLQDLINSHLNSGKLATVTAVRPPARFGYLKFNNDGLVTHFGEKNQADEGWINGGFFVLNKEIQNYILGDYEPFEIGPLSILSKNSQLNSYKHEGFWKPMDTLREKKELELIAKKAVPDWLDFNFILP